MTIKYSKGYIKVGQYDGERETQSGKKLTRFTLSTKQGSERVYLNGMTVWHDNGHPEAVEDGRYVLVEYDETEWQSGEKRGFNRNVYRIWVPADDYAPRTEAYSDDDLPF